MNADLKERHWLVWITVLVHLVLAVTCAVGGWVVYREMGKPDIMAQGAGMLRGLTIGVGACLVCAFIYGVITVGLWKRWRWTWWLGVALSGFIAGVILLEPITDRSVDWDDLWVGSIFAVVTVMLLLPPVRKFIFKRDSGSPKAGVAQVQA